jgi:hypothetical protein
MHTKFLLENLKERDHMEDTDIDGMDLWEIGWEGVDWMHLAQDRDQWYALMNVVMNFWVP